MEEGRQRRNLRNQLTPNSLLGSNLHNKLRGRNLNKPLGRKPSNPLGRNLSSQSDRRRNLNDCDESFRDRRRWIYR